MKHSLRTAALVGLITAAFGGLLASSGADLALERSGLRLLFLARGPVAAPDEVVIVSVDEKSARAFGESPEPLQWPRYWYACLVDILARRGAELIVFDIFFGERRVPGAPPSAAFDREPGCERARADLAQGADPDRALAAALRRARLRPAAGTASTPVVLLEYVEQRRVARGGVEMAQETRVPPVAPLSAAASAAAPFVLPKGWAGRFWPVKPVAGEARPTLPLAALQLYLLPEHGRLREALERAGLGDTERLRAPQHTGGAAAVHELMATLRQAFEADRALARRTLADLERMKRTATSDQERRAAAALVSLVDAYRTDQPTYLNFYGPPATIRTLSLVDVIRGQPDLEGRVVFVGASDPSMVEQADAFNTVFSSPDGIDLSGVEIAATAFANLLAGDTLRRPPMLARVGMVLVFGVAVGMAAYLLHGWLAVVAVLGLWLGGFALAAYIFGRENVWLPVSVPFLQMPAALVLGLTLRYLVAQRERRSVSEAFRRFVPVAPADQAKRETKLGTILFADIEGFTKLGERLAPDALIRLLDDYFSAVSRPIHAHKGVITQYQGDAILAVFNVLEADPDHAAHAVRAALEMQEIVENTTFGDGARLRTRIGINTGLLVAGTVGSADRMTYTVHGDAVNLAARLEALNKQYGTRVIISETTAKLLGPEFVYEPIGEVVIRGKAANVTIYKAA